MNLVRNGFTSILLVSLLVSLGSVDSICGQDTIPSTPAGNCLSKFLSVINGDDDSAREAFLKEGFAKNDPETVKQRTGQTNQVRNQLGKLTFKKITSSSDTQISAVCKTAMGPNVILSIETTGEPAKISSIDLEMGGIDEEANHSPLNAESRAKVIRRLVEELRSKYVFPKVGEKMALDLEASLKAGDYDDVTEAREFAANLTDQLRAICKDKHLRVRAGFPRRPSQSPGRRPVDNHGFAKVEMLPGGIGYLKFDFFSGDEAAQKTASAAMNFLANSNTLIFDLRENGGGSPEMIAYLTSYLFDEPVHLNSFYNRPTDSTTESWTQKDVPGEKFSPETDVFVLTSNYTFSGAEEFSYNLQNLKRGTIVGETTGGGAHPVMPVTLGDQMHITMPFARAINPITKTNWEGVGVKPDVEVASDEALDKAVEIARQRMEQVVSDDKESKEKTETANRDIEELAANAAELMSQGSFQAAAAEFQKLTQLAPKQGRAWFNYGYCLHASGELDKAIEIHKKAANFEQFAGIATYNLACAYSLKSQSDEAISALEKAIELGFRDAAQLKGDSDFDNIRKDTRFVDALNKIRNNR